jgi:Spy/CpxP family protein refolding chaperone
MKKTLIATGLLLVSIVALGGPGKDGEHRGRMHQALGLSAEQVEEIEAIKDAGGSREDIQQVLTEEQREKAAQLREKRHAKFAARLGRMQEHLGLSDDQVAEMKAIRESGGSREDVHAVLTDEQRDQLAELRAAHPGRSRD